VALAEGLRRQGFSAAELAGIVGENWLTFFDTSFGPGNV